MIVRSWTAGGAGLLTALALAAPAQAQPRAVPGGVEFIYEDSTVASVSLAGSFNQWNKAANPMKLGGDGVWRVTLPLAPGRYEYKFVVNDNDWTADPANPVTVGNYGNSELVIGADGGIVQRAVSGFLANTPLNSRVAIGGNMRSSYDSRSDVANDPRFRLQRPAHEINLDVNVRASDVLAGGVRMRFDYRQGSINDVKPELYSSHLTFTGKQLELEGYLNEESFQLDEPFRALGHEDLRGSIEREDIPLGRGTHGVWAKGSVGPARLEAFYGNRYDNDRFNDPALYDDVSDEFLAARAAYGYRAVQVGASLVQRRNGWWVDFNQYGNQYPDELTRFKSQTGSTSDNFEIGVTDRLFALDASAPIPNPWLTARARTGVGVQRWRAAWDVGNREQLKGSEFTDGPLDVEVGRNDGWRWVGEANATRGRWAARWRLEVRRFDAMDTASAYVGFGTPEAADAPVFTYHNVFQTAGWDVSRFPALPERRNDLTETTVRWSDGRTELGLSTYREFERRIYAYVPSAQAEVANRRLSWVPRFSTRLWKERVRLGLTAEIVQNRLGGDRAFFRTQAAAFLTRPRAYTTFNPTREVILDAWVKLTGPWAALADLRRMEYLDDGTLDPLGPDRIFFNPYVALQYQPRPNLEVRLSYGVNPTQYRDAPFGGRANGRQIWRDEHRFGRPGAGELDAERALEDVTQVSILGIIGF